MRLFSFLFILFSVSAFAEGDDCAQLQPNSWAWVQNDCHLGQPHSLPPVVPPKLDSGGRNTSEIDYSRWVSLYSFPYPRINNYYN